MRFIKTNKILLLLIILLACWLRFSYLSQIPNGFSDDEAAFGYNAYSILKTGTDEWGKLLPLTSFQSFGDYKLPVYFYLTSASVFVFGLTEFATRFPTAIFGVLSTIGTYFLVRKLFDEKTGLLAAFLLTISPFHIFVSRHALESAVPIFFNLVSVLFFIKSFKDKRLILISMVFFAFNLYIYRSTWLFVPVYLAALLILFKEEVKKNFKNCAIGLALFAVLATPIAITSFSSSGTSRLRQIGITSEFNMIGLINDVNYQRGLCQESLPQPVCKFTYNKYFAVVTKYASNYVSHFSPQLLFINGSQDGEQMLKGRGFLYFIELPFIIIAVIFLGARLKSKESRILLPWLLIYPLASASAGFETPGRQAISMPIWQILSAVGFFLFYSYITKVKQKSLVAIIILLLSSVLLFEFGKFLVDYFVIYPQTSPRSFRYGYKQLFNFLKSQEGSYNQFIISNKLDQSHQYIFQLFFQEIDPGYYQNPINVTRYFDQGGWVVVTRIGNYYYAPSVPDLNKFAPRSLLVVTKGEVNNQTEPIFKIDYPQGGNVFEVYDIDRLKGN